jgi:hypothetical protein
VAIVRQDAGRLLETSPSAADRACGLLGVFDAEAGDAGLRLARADLAADVSARSLSLRRRPVGSWDRCHTDAR